MADKDPAAVALGRKGGRASVAKWTRAELVARMTKLSRKAKRARITGRKRVA